MTKERVFTRMMTITMVVISLLMLNHQRGLCEEFVYKYHALAETDTRVYGLELLRLVLEKSGRISPDR